MKALAWDDEANATDVSLRYTQRLRDELARYGVEIDLLDDPGEFIAKANKHKYDLFLTDWVNENATAKEGKNFGSVLLNAIRAVNFSTPIFVVSRHTKMISESMLNLGKPIFLKSKDVSASWLAHDIFETLKDLGLIVNSKRVFLIEGHSKQSSSAVDELTHFLKEHGIDPEPLKLRRSPDGLSLPLRLELLTTAAFIAVCTPDETCGKGKKDKRQQPIRDVFFELGLIHGLPQGARKLIVLRQDGLLEDTAMLELGWGGHHELTFANSVTEVKEDLKRRLKALGVKMD